MTGLAFHNALTIDENLNYVNERLIFIRASKEVSCEIEDPHHNPIDIMKITTHGNENLVSTKITKLSLHLKAGFIALGVAGIAANRWPSMTITMWRP